MKEFKDEHFVLHSDAFFGCGEARRLGSMLGDWGFRKAGIMVDQMVASHPPGRELLDQLKRSGLLAKVYEIECSAEPSYAYLDKVAAEFRRGEYDVLIAIGGGSTLDLAKGAGVLLTNAGLAIDYRGMNLVRRPGVPVVMMPTTAGTGSEVTHTASFIDSESQTKLGINGRHVNCLFSVLDPELLTTCPRPVTIGAGLDALVHAIEGATCRTANTVSRLFGREAVRLMFEGLPTAVATPSDLPARSATLIGSHYAGLAMANAGGGPASGISYPLGVHHNVPHGFAGGLLLPHVVAFNVKQGYWDGYADLFDGLGVIGKRTASKERKAHEFSERLFTLYQSIEAPQTFTDFGLGKSGIPLLTRLTLEQRLTNLELNPVPFGESDVEALLAHVLD